MTPAEELAVVRARLERMVALAEPECWFSGLVLCAAQKDLDVLDRHRLDGRCCNWGFTVPSCPEVAGVLRAWGDGA